MKPTFDGLYSAVGSKLDPSETGFKGLYRTSCKELLFSSLDHGSYQNQPLRLLQDHAPRTHLKGDPVSPMC